ncbi:hypothetical protein AMTRI_Chr01g126300 [Amborella trichopoda]
MGASIEQVSMIRKGEEYMDLPPGFRFHPTDEELITSYLIEKVMNGSFTARAIGEADLNKCEPWDLPWKAKMGEKEWYVFCLRDRKYPTGLRTNRATEAGYWKATGKDKEIYKGRKTLVGMKKTLVFYKGRAPKGEKTNWVMHEYRLEGKYSYNNLSRTTTKDEWVVSRIFHKSSAGKRAPFSGLLRINSFGDELRSPSLPPLMDSSVTNASSSLMDDGIRERVDMPSFSTSLEEQNDQLMSFGLNRYGGLGPGGVNPGATSHNPAYHPHFSRFNSLYPYQTPSGFNTMNHPRNNQAPLYLHSSLDTSDRAMLRTVADGHGAKRFKVEQERGSSLLQEPPRCVVSNQSMVSISQDTGMSTDVNTEISSVVSKHEFCSRPFEDLEALSSSAGPVDLDCLWNY